MISDHKKEEVKQASDIVEVIQDYVKLKRSGSGFMGLCPFHNEKSPSFHVTPSMGIYKCFGCGAGGDVFNFMMEMEGVGFTEAVRSLGERFGVDIPEDTPYEQDETYQIKEGIYHALKFAGKFYYECLMKTDQGETAREYLKKRGFTIDTIKKYGLGFAPNSGTAFLDAALKIGLNEAYLHEAGLLKMRQDGQSAYDAFRDRVMFPIFNPSGKVIAFGGRILKDNVKAPKYINSPQTKVYNKSETLYGIHVAKNEIRKEKEAILVEGYTDVLSLHQAGLRNAISTSGTSLTPDQMRVLHRYGETLLFIYDSDNAGQAAMLRGINIALEEGLGVRVLKLPESEDPDSFVKQFGKEGFLAYKKDEAKDFVRFMIETARSKGEWDDPVTKSHVITRILTSIATIPDAVSKDNYIQHLSSLSKIGDRALYEELGIIEGQKRKQEKQRNFRDKQIAQREEQNIPPSGDPSPQPPAQGIAKKEPKRQEKIPAYEKEVIRLMLLYGKPVVAYIGAQINVDHFEYEAMREFYEDMIQRFQNDEEISVDVYMDKGHPYPELVGEVIMERFSISELGNERRMTPVKRDGELYKTVRGALKALRIHFLSRIREICQQKYAQSDGEEKVELSSTLRDITQQYSVLKSRSPEDIFPKAEQELITKKEDLK